MTIRVGIGGWSYELMNEIESEAEGEVMRVFAENGQPVEYGQPLFGIRPSRKK